MKKSLFGRAFALLAAGALVFAALGCDSGNDEYIEETPTNYYMDGFANAVADADVTINAVWNFEGWADGNPFAEKALAEATADIDAKKTGTGATLDVNNVKGKANTNVLQTSNATATLASLSESTYNFKLTTTAATNLVIKAKGAGAATAARLLAIADPAGTVLASKANMGNTTDVLFVVPGIAAGTYTIYANGVSIYYINAGAKEEDGVSAPTLVSKLELQLNGEKASDSPDSIKAILETIEFTVNSIDEEGAATDVTQDAVWTSSNENIAVVNAGTVTGVAPGKATIRARIGRFYDERVVTITESGITSSATFFAKDNFPDKEEKELGLDWTAADVKAVADKLLKAAVVGDSVTVSDATISFFDANTSWDVLPTVHAKSDATGDLTQAWDKKLGVRMKPGKYSNGNFAQGFKFAEISFKVTPKSGTQKIVLRIKARGGKNVNITPIVGSETKDAVKVGSSTSLQTELFKDVLITSETTVKLEFSVADKDKNGVGFGFQDLTLYAGASE